jgi:hypothetical protein
VRGGGRHALRCNPERDDAHRDTEEHPNAHVRS